MPTYETPADLIARLPEGSAQRWATYTPSPKAMSADLWEQQRLTLLALVADTESRSEIDARNVLSAVCGLVGWVVELYQYEDLQEMFAIERIEEYLATNAARRTNSTRSNDRGRLMRCHRVLNGEQAITRRKARAPGADPYQRRDIEALLEAATGGRALIRVLAVALTTGRASTDAVGSPMPTRRGLAVAVRRLGHPAVSVDALLQDGGVLVDDDWPLARQAARSAGLDLTSRQLRMTWLLPVLRQQASLAQIVAEHPLTRRDLDGAMGHCPTPNQTEVRALLRG